MKLCRTLLRGLPAFVLAASALFAQETPQKQPQEIFAGALLKIAGVLEPAAGAPAQTFSAQLKVVKADGLPKELLGRTAELAYQAPDRLRLSAVLDGHSYSLGRDRQNLWVHSAEKKFGVVGAPGQARFLSAPDKIDATQLKPVKLPLPKEQLALLPLLMKVELLPAETLDNVRCQVLKAAPQPEALQALKIPNVQFDLCVRETDQLPARLGYADGKGVHLQIDLQNIKLEEAWPDENGKSRLALEKRPRPWLYRMSRVSFPRRCPPSARRFPRWVLPRASAGSWPAKARAAWKSSTGQKCFF